MKLVPDQETESGGLSLFPDTPSTVYNPEYSQEKADRFAAVLGEANPGTDILTTDISSGYQDKWNQLLKAREDTNRMIMRNDILTNMAATRDRSRPMTSDDLAIVESLTNDELYSQDVSTILEKKYSDFYTNLMATQEENAVFQESLKEDEEGSLDALDRAQFPMQRTLIARDLLESTQKRYDDTSWASWGLDTAKTFIPLYSTLKGRERIETPTGSWLAGNNREEQLSQLYAMNPVEFKQTTQQIIDELAEDNMVLALEFAQDIQSFSASDAAWGNTFTVADAVSLVPGAAVAKLGKGLKTAGKAIATNPQDLGKMAASAGFNRTAATTNVTKNILSGDLSGVSTMRRIDEISDKLPSIFAPNQFMTGGSKYLSAEAQARLEVAVQDGANGVLRVLSEGSGVDRLEPSQVSRAVDEAYNGIVDMFPSNTHKVIDTQVYPASADRVTNTAVLEVRFGRQDGQFFKYEETAKRYADKYIGLKTDDYTIRQDTLGGYYIAVQKPLKDVGDFRTEVIETTMATPDTFNNRFARALRSPDYLLSKPNVSARGMAVGHVEYLTEIVDDATKPFRGKSSQWYNEMDTMFRTSRVQKRYFKTAGDFEDSFYKKFKKPPTEDQYDAYFRYVQMSDLDYIVRDADKVKRMTSKGLENFDFRMQAVTGQGPERMESVTGKVVDRLPLERKEPFRVRVVQDGKETHNFPNMMAKWSDRKELIENLIKQNYRIIQHAEGGMFTLVKDPKRNSIKMKTLGYIEGGHIEPKYDFYVRQGKIDDREGAKVLTGDTNLGTVPTLSQAKEVAEVFEQARKLVKAKDPAAKEFIDKNLPISYGEFVKKVKTGDINLDVPIVATTRGQRSSEVLKYESVFGKDFHDLQSSDLNLLLDTDPRYASERSENLLDVFTADNGTVIKQEWEPVLDPMDALASATRNMIDVRAMEDYAIKSTNDWVQEFGHLLDVHPEVLKANPRYYLQNPVYKSSIDKDRAEAARVSMLSLFNQVDSMDSGRNVVKDKVLEKVFSVSGEKARDFLDTNWVGAKDAQTLIRRTAFDLKLGMWNVKQLFLQSTSIAATMAISPRSGIQGMRSLPIVRYALLTGDDNVIRGLHNKFGKLMGWGKDDFINMVHSMKQSGFANVGGDHTYLDQMSLKTPGKQLLGRVKNSPIGKVASTHRVFFNEGELSARIMAYSTAYDEFIKRNPGKVPDRFQQAEILSRAKTFTQNMTRESNAPWQRGWAAVATQFMSYHMRVAEQIWDGGFGSGKKLTQAEKLRFLGAMSLLYGGGTAVSATLPIFPTKDMMRDWAAEAGIDFNQYPVADAAIDGLWTTSVEALTGAEMDFSNYGPSGLPTFYDLFNEDVTFAEAFLGAGTGIMADLGQSVSNLAYAYGYGEGDVTGADLLELFRNISSVDNTTKLIIALNSGKYLSRKGTYITDVNESEAWLQAILGVSPERVAESFSKATALKSMQNVRNEGRKLYEKYHLSAMRAWQNGDEDSYRIYMKRRDTVKAGYDLTPSEVNSIRTRAFPDNPVDEQLDKRAQDWNRKYKLFNQEGN